MGYATDLTTNQRNFIFENFPEIFKTKSKADLFEILNALFFLIKTGCQWKLLPNDFPKWRTVYEFYRKWTSTGFFDRLTCRLNAQSREIVAAYSCRHRQPKRTHGAVTLRKGSGRRKENQGHKKAFGRRFKRVSPDCCDIARKCP